MKAGMEIDAKHPRYLSIAYSATFPYGVLVCARVVYADTMA